MHLCWTKRLALTVFALFTLSTASYADGPIRINGTGSGLVFMKSLIAAYQKANPKTAFDIQQSLGSSGAIKALGRGALDIVISGRVLSDKESSQLLTCYEYGRSPLAILTNLKSPNLERLTYEDLLAIYSGRVTTWSNGDQVRLVLRPLEEIDTKILRDFSPEMDQAVIAAHQRKDRLIAVTDNDAFEMVKKTPGAVGLVALVMPYTDPNKVKITRFNAYLPAVHRLVSGVYPLYKTFYIVTTSTPSPAVRDFLNFLNSPNVRNVAKKAGVHVTVKAQ